MKRLVTVVVLILAVDAFSWAQDIVTPRLDSPLPLSWNPNLINGRVIGELVEAANNLQEQIDYLDDQKSKEMESLDNEVRQLRETVEAQAKQIDDLTSEVKDLLVQSLIGNREWGGLSAWTANKARDEGFSSWRRMLGAVSAGFNLRNRIPGRYHGLSTWKAQKRE